MLSMVRQDQLAVLANLVRNIQAEGFPGQKENKNDDIYEVLAGPSGP